MAQRRNTIPITPNQQVGDDVNVDDSLTVPPPPSYFQRLLQQPPLVIPSTLSQSQTRFDALKRLQSRPTVGDEITVDDVIFG